MAKTTHVAKLEQELAQAREGEAAAQEQATTARKAYQSAVDGGDMDAAHEHRAEAERLEGVAQMHADRVATLEAKRGEAESADAMPAYKQAMKEAETAIAAEAAAHQRVADLIGQLAEARRDLDEVHADVGSKVAAAHRAADAAGQARDEFRQRSRMASAVDVDTLFKTTRALANVSSDQSAKVHNVRERARKAA